MWLLVFSSQALCFWNITSTVATVPHQLFFYWHHYCYFFSIMGKCIESQSRTEEVLCWQNPLKYLTSLVLSPLKMEKSCREVEGRRFPAYENVNSHSSLQVWVPKNPSFDLGWRHLTIDLDMFLWFCPCQPFS